MDYPRTYNPCDECPYGIDKRGGSGNDSMCKICEFTALLNRRAAPESKPLTLDELRQMDGKPVWLVTKSFQDWRQYAYDEPKYKLIAFWQFGDEEEDTFDLNEYGKSVFAYACKPEESASQQLCSEDENFIQTKFGYCFYTLNSSPLIYNLYVRPQYRHHGYSRALLKLVIGEIRKNGYKGKIHIQAEPRENSIRLADLTKYYKSIGLAIYEARKPEA